MKRILFVLAFCLVMTASALISAQAVTIYSEDFNAGPAGASILSAPYSWIADGVAGSLWLAATSHPGWTGYAMTDSHEYKGAFIGWHKPITQLNSGTVYFRSKVWTASTGKGHQSTIGLARDSGVYDGAYVGFYYNYTTGWTFRCNIGGGTGTQLVYNAGVDGESILDTYIDFAQGKAWGSVTIGGVTYNSSVMTFTTGPTVYLDSVGVCGDDRYFLADVDDLLVVPYVYIGYQGKLSNDGLPVNGPASIKFDLFDVATGGNAVWSGTASSVTVTNGVFTKKIGPVSTSLFSAKPDMWLQVTANGQVISPRAKLDAVPYAMALGSATSFTTLVNNGRPAGCIVLPQGTTSEKVLTAANDLSGYIKQISGATIPIVLDNQPTTGFRIFIGSTTLSPVDPAAITDAAIGYDGFILHSVDNGLIVAGRTNDGTANGVYAFAEDVLGLHWFSMDQNGPTGPVQTTVNIPSLYRTVKPDFKLRLHGYTLVYQYLSPAEKNNMVRWGVFNRVGGIDADLYHSYAVFCPDSLFETNRVYFPKINGQRRLRYPDGDTHDLQRCLSNTDLQALAASWAAGIFSAYPAKQYASLSPSDYEDGWCECNFCAAMGATPSDQSLKFANAVADLNQTQYSDRGYYFLCYLGNLQPPTAGLTARSNVVPNIAPMLNGRTHSIYSDCPYCGIAKRNIYQGWAAASTQLACYNYYAWSIFVGPGLITNAEELRYFRDLGGKAWYREHTTYPGVNWDLLTWAETKQWWDVDQDASKLRRQFIEGYYGSAAADPIERVYINYENAMRSASYEERHPLYNHNFLPFSFYSSAQTLSWADIQSAIAIAGSQPEPYKTRILRDMNNYLILDNQVPRT